MITCKKCSHIDTREFKYCPNCGTLNKEQIIKQALETDEGRKALARAMVDPIYDVLDNLDKFNPKEPHWLFLDNKIKRK